MIDTVGPAAVATVAPAEGGVNGGESGGLALLHGPEERALLGQDEASRLGALEVGEALRVLPQAGAIGLVGGEAVTGDQAPGDVVGALMAFDES